MDLPTTSPGSRYGQRPDPLYRLNQFYRAARKRAWDVEVLGWEALPPVPRAEQERWRIFWASVIRQQLQADRIAIRAATDLLVSVPEKEARLYYSTMVQDEARHVEGWTRLASTLEAVDGEDPFLEEMGAMLLTGKTIEEQVVAFQVVFEGAAIYAFRDIASATTSTVLGEMARRLVRDDSIHHNSGVAYAEHLLLDATPALKRHIEEVLRRYAPLYIEHLTWRPPARRWLSHFMEDRDAATIARNQHFINKAVFALGLKPPFDL